MVETKTRTQVKAGQPASYDAAFTPGDWGLLVAIASMWGSSFVWIEEALESFQPTLIAFIRIFLGAATLAMFRRSWKKVGRADLPAVALLGLIWMAGPFLLFAFAQQWIDSSLAGMLNGAVPIFAAVVGVIISRRSPGPVQVVGLALGFAGVVLVGLPFLGGAGTTVLGIGLVLSACICYGTAVHVAAPLQQRYGALPVLLRAQGFALAFTAIPALFGLRDSTWAWSSALATVPLGALGTGLAFFCMITLVGRVGGGRGSITIYFVPVVAIVLGAVLRSETIELISVAGTALVILGAILAARPEAPRSEIEPATS